MGLHGTLGKISFQAVGENSQKEYLPIGNQKILLITFEWTRKFSED